MRDIMTAAPTAVDARTSVASVARAMRDQDIHIVPVTDDGGLVGLVSDRDLVIGALADGADPQQTTVALAVRGDLITVGADEDMDEATTTMREHAARHAAVIEDGELIGLVCIDDPGADASSSPLIAPTPPAGQDQANVD
ncbi:CBS domain-containing protein [Streptomyces sp. NPDC090108]|uniref:CBS domain-containing protein n=1 Tax=Streptomyces sp. NPDC090108 TaxID=3365947 RepID=UPI00381372B4